MQLLQKTEDQTWVVAGSSEQLAEKAGPVCGGGLLSGEINVDNCYVDGSLSSSILSKMCQTGSLSSKLCHCEVSTCVETAPTCGI